MGFQIIHVEIGNVVWNAHCHKAINGGLEFNQDENVNFLIIQSDFVDEVAFGFFVMVGYKRFIDGFATIKIQFAYPWLFYKGLQKLAEDGFVGE
jgi:hypothetical protein